MWILIKKKEILSENILNRWTWLLLFIYLKFILFANVVKIVEKEPKLMGDIYDDILSYFIALFLVVTLF